MTALKRVSVALLAALALAAGIAGGTLTRYAIEDATLPPCPTEDSTGCYWDASESGNGLGNDVVTP